MKRYIVSSYSGDGKEYYYQSEFPKKLINMLYDAGYLKSEPWTAISPDQSVFNAIAQAALHSIDESLLSYLFNYNDEYSSQYIDDRFAMNPNVPAYILKDLYLVYSGLTQNMSGQILVHVIKNPNTPVDIIEQLANSTSRLVSSNAQAELNNRM